ncbi:hypothetical protein [Ruicaihuangia caeni]|uniref:hypothetical protein n=1 Tax=Ruicaihuangia caeni TaxID=3042517 RepID=UPI00338FA1D7
MEFASYLAGERWSDHPKCTHAGLANLARMVNDCTSDAARSELAPMIPSVIGLTSDDVRLDMLLAVEASAAALPVAFEERQRSLAVGALVLEATLDAQGGMPDDMRSRLHAAFSSAPAAERWARGFLGRYLRKLPREMSARHCRCLVQSAVDGIALACVDDNDARLRRLLKRGIELAHQFVDAERVAEQTASAATASTGTVSRTADREYASA